MCVKVLNQSYPNECGGKTYRMTRIVNDKKYSVAFETTGFMSRAHVAHMLRYWRFALRQAMAGERH